GVRPQRALIEVWPPALAARLYPVPSETNRWRQTDARVLADCWGDSFPRRQWQQNCLAPLLAHRQRSLSYAAPWLLRKADRLDSTWAGQDGWGGQVTPPLAAHDPERFARAAARDRGAFHGLLTPFRVKPPADRALRELLALCRRQGIEAALLFMPEARAL